MRDVARGWKTNGKRGAPGRKCKKHRQKLKKVKFGVNSHFLSFVLSRDGVNSVKNMEDLTESVRKTSLTGNLII